MAPAYAGDGPGGSVIVAHPGNFNIEEAGQANKDDEYERASFLELMLREKAEHLLGSIRTVPGFIIVAPVAIRKVKKPLTNRNKESIANYIADNPGCTTYQIMKNKNLPKGTVRYHIKKLDAEGKINLKKMGKFVRLFASSSSISEKEKLVASYTSNEKDRMFLSKIFNSGGMTNKELSGKFNMNKSATYWRLKKFVDTNIVESRQEGRHKMYYICPDVRNMMVKYFDGK